MIAIRASEMERIFRCPGSFRAQELSRRQRRKDQPEIVDEAAASGTRVHMALQWFFGFGVTDIDDLQTICSLTDPEKVKVRWFINRVITIMVEHNGAKRVTCEANLQDWTNGISGAPDIVYECRDETVHINDYKSGWGTTIIPRLNLQLRTYVVLLADAWHVNRIYAHIIAWADNPASATLYQQKDIEEARKELYYIRSMAMRENARRYPSVTSCTYCRACGNPVACPESCEWKASLLPTICESAPPAKITARLENIYLTLQAAVIAKKRFDAYLKDVIERYPEAVPWATLKPGRTIRTITDANKCFQVGIQQGWFDQEEYVGQCIDVKLPEIEKLARKHHRKPKDVADILQAAGALEIRTAQPSIKRKQDDDANEPLEIT